jgi:aldose 1-epimerase
MPAGLGWHPYFVSSGAQLSAGVSAIWSSDDETIPDRARPLTPDNDLTELRDVKTLRLDHAFDWPGERATIRWPERNLAAELTASENLDHLIVFTPEGEDRFCVEPASHAPNVLNITDAAPSARLVELGPGETLEGCIEIALIRPG